METFGIAAILLAVWVLMGGLKEAILAYRGKND